jgi:hypothetical protein
MLFLSGVEMEMRQEKWMKVLSWQTVTGAWLVYGVLLSLSMSGFYLLG